MADSEFLFKAEYAKSDRSSCKKCRQGIGKGALRMAKMVQSPHFDGKIPNWYHYPCFWKVATVTVATQIAGFDGLRWNDQEKIKNKIGGDTSGETLEDKVVARKSVIKDFSVEYAKSDRSKCRVCNEKIAKDELRVGNLEKTDDNYTSQTWHHVKCFCDPLKLVEMGWLKEFKATDVPGFSALNKKDQTELKKKLVLKADVKRKLETPDAGSSPKKAKVETKEDKAMREQSQFLWKIRDQLSRFVAVKALKELLEENNQYPPKGESALLDAVADGMAFGALEKCPECTRGQLVIRSDSYHCTGNLTSWTKCMYTSKEPAKKAWVTPDSFKEIKFLKEFKFKPFNKGVRVFSEVAPMPSTSTVAAAEPEKPLQNVKIGLIGKLSKTNKVITTEIEELGGEVVSKIDKEVACCISTAADVKKMAKKMKDAQSADVHIVSEDFLESVKKGGAALMITKHSIASWGADPATRIDSNVTQVDAGPSAADMEEQKYRKDVDKLKMMVKGGAAVDPDSGLQATAHVYNVKDLVYNATLGMVDIMKGTNSFYKLQLLEDDVSSKWYLFRAWGRVGTTIGGNKLENFTSREGAIEQFKTVYREKTGNYFGVKNFKKHPNKFFPLEIDYGDDEEEAITLKAGTGSTLPTSVQELMVMIFDIDTMKRTMVEFEIDLKKMPLGKLSKRQIESAYSVLSEALKLVEGGGNIKAAILDCSNRFYTLIPHDFGLKKPPMLDDVELIKAKTQMLDNLLDIEVAYSLLKGGNKTAGKDPIDANYEKLRCSIDPVEKKSKDYKMVEQFISNSNDAKSSLNLEVLDVYKIEREDEPKRFQKNLHNRRLLWHGSRVSNFAGILSQGLRIAPPEAPVSGYLYGKGIYFADMVAKSMWYCRTSKADNIGLMLLCDVALGNMYEIPHTEYMEKAPAGKHSTRGIGRIEPDPKQSVKKDGYLVPYGKPKSTGVGRSYNEFIVYDITQVQMKYLIKIDFQHAY
ncbi:poly [ADP-ribose] polymerase 1-like [Ptychodera flava]|uniref:poly [ADP-ribose] polymerase 1-like n=1 Tax=Ptychodera flava TaxID=63121 RepID=UPI00396A6D5A